MSSRCLICHQPVAIQISWSQIFSKETNNKVCEECTSRLEVITGKQCKKCGRPAKHSEYAFKGEICYDCVRWEQDPDWRGYLRNNESLFYYNDFLKEVLAIFKYRGDYLLADVFSSYVKAKLTRSKFDTIIPIPLSAERQYERGFNQAEAIIAAAGYKPTHLLQRAHTEKQSKKSRADRIHLPQVFSILSAAKVKEQNIFIVDDIYTTGSTLRHASKVLMEGGARSVVSLTVARG
jgi:competence protein ComFC